MIKNYVKTAWRNLGKNWVYTLQNILGLTIAFSISILGTLYLTNERSYDRHYPNASRIYRIDTDIKAHDFARYSAKTSDVIGPIAMDMSPHITAYVRIFPYKRPFHVRQGSEFIEESNAAYADSSLFDVFQLTLISPHQPPPLNQPNTVVVTESMAKKYFGSSDVVGRTLEFNGVDMATQQNGTYTIAAVVVDFDKNSHMNFDFIFPLADLSYGWGNYVGTNFHTYTLLDEGANPSEVNRTLATIVEKNIYPNFTQQLGIDSKKWQQFETDGNRFRYSLFPITDIHLRSDKPDELEPGGNLQIVYIISLLLAFIVLISSINFANLSTAQALDRYKEMGVRKVMGGNNRSLIAQFLAESTVLVLIAFILAVVLAILLIPHVNGMTQKSFDMSDLMTWRMILPVAVIVVLVGGCAGSYPAFHLSRIKPIYMLQGKTGKKTNKRLTTKMLITTQFALSITFIVASIVIYSQLEYVKNRDIGYVKEEILVINQIGRLEERGQLFKQDVLKVQGISNGSFTSSLPVNSMKLYGHFSYGSTQQEHESIQAINWFVDERFIETLGMSMSSGRNFSGTHSSDLQTVVINEVAARQLGEANPIGRQLYTQLADYTIIGIVKDFHFESLRESVEPLVLNYSDNANRFAVFKIAPTANMKSILDNIDQTWQTYSPDYPMSFFFLDDSFHHTYQADKLLGLLAMIGAVISIVVAGIGLLSMASYSIRKRRKEISIRKVLGASTISIINLLSKEYVTLVALALLVSVPVSWWGMNTWLQDFAYRAEISWWVFVVTATLVLLFTLLTIGIQAIGSAYGNPTDNLRDD